MADQPQMKSEGGKETVRFHYIKSNAFRVIFSDGVYGGPTPQGLLHMVFWSERPPIPQATEQEVLVRSDGSALVSAAERIVEGKSGFVREVECGVTMTLARAKSFRDWLNNHIAQLEKLTPEIPK